MGVRRQSDDRDADLASAIDAEPDYDCDGAPSMLLQTFTQTTYPTTAARVYACRPVRATAALTEGATASYVVDSTRTYYAANLGSAIPPSGTRVVAVQRNGSWVFRYD